MMRIVLEQRQMLKMVMTTELRQAIELLQLSTYELMQFIREQAEENPFIELIEKDHDTPINIRRTSVDSANPIDYSVSDKKTIYDQLMEQLVDYDLTDFEKTLMEYLIYNIDEQGYLTITDEEVCDHLGISEKEVYRAKNILHQLEPAGIGAGDLYECLVIQAKRKFPGNGMLVTIIENHLTNIAENKWDIIAEDLNVSLQKIKDLIKMIQTLNPRPVDQLEGEKAEYVTPDIFIDRLEESNQFSISLNDYYLPEIKFNYTYSNECKHVNELSKYVDNHFQKFQWLLKSIEQRRTTILKIMDVIVNRQHAYLSIGSPTALEALTLKEVADEIGMHESTVSRATMNKVVQTPVGTFDLRKLFSKKLATKDGKSTSQSKVKALLVEMIDNEDKQKPLSDQKISDLFKQEKKIVISRRTVAKYREELHIPSSTKRKI